MKAIQEMEFTSIGQKKEHKVVSIGAHGAATHPLGPYFIQITVSLEIGKGRKWKSISLPVEYAKQLERELHDAITNRKGVTNGDATFEQIATCLEVEQH